MKKYLRLFLVNLAALWVAISLLEGVTISGGSQTLALAALVLTAIDFIVKPLIKLLLLPINLVTLGAFRWLINVISLYLVTLIVPQFKVASFLFAGFSYRGFIIPSIPLSIFWVFVVASLLISLTATFLLWLAK